MNCQKRMSSIILLLLWTFCTCGSGIENGTNVTVVDNTGIPPTRGSMFDTQVQNPHEIGSSPTANPTLNTAEQYMRNTSRSKLWSPYSSTLVNFTEENDDEVSIAENRNSVPSADFLGESDVARVTHDEAKVDDSESAPKLPIISSIRHYRSRKSFVRTRKSPSNIKSELTVKASDVDVTDFEKEQGDQPYYSPISTTTPASIITSAKYASGTQAFNYGKVVEGKENTRGQSSGISSRSDVESVYGIPYFTPTTSKEADSSTKLQKINKTFLFQKRAKNNASKTSNSGSSLLSKSKEKDDISEGHSDDVKFGVPILQPNQIPFPTSSAEIVDGLSTEYQRNRGRVVSNSSDADPTKKPQRGKSAGKKSRKQGSKKGLKLGDPVKFNEDESTGSSSRGSELEYPFGQSQSTSLSSTPPNTDIYHRPASGSERKRIGNELQHGAFRQVKEKQRVASRQPEIRGKSDYKPNYNSDAHSNDNDHPSQVPQGAAPQTQNMIRNSPTSSDIHNDGASNKKPMNHPSSEFFPKVKSNLTFLDNSDQYDTAVKNNFYESDNPKVPSSDGNVDEFDILDVSSPTSEDIDSFAAFTPAKDIVTEFLNIVESQHLLGENCSRGTEYNLGEGVVDRYAQERFRLEAELTVNRANMLTRFWKYADPRTLTDEYMLHAMVISLIEFDEDIFAAGNCYGENQYKNYTLFCPYGYRERDGSILVKDLSLEYHYLSNTSEWFYKARKDGERVVRNFNRFSRGFHNFRFNQSNITVEDEILNVTYEDGKWSKPYFDCGGGNIWMMTYAVPFFGYNGTYYFKGTSGIDIDLRRVDIDQCPLPKNSTELNIFAASDKCKKATTKCVPMKGLGFRRGSYRCECKDGFYFPNVSSPFKYFNGTLLEEEYEKKFTGNETSLYDTEGQYECLMCPVGCDTCVDDRPCVVSLNWLMRTAILILQLAIIGMLPIVGLFTWKYSNVKVVRAASPVLLRFIVLGAFFIYCTILVMYPSPSVITCTLRVWLREIGFSLAYGALMLKTWRISVIFRVRSAKAIKITDLDLMKRLGIIVGVFTSLLVIRTLVAPPVAIVSLTADELKAWLCKSDWWDHSFTIMELSFLVWGIRLCIVVRKAPSEFNESKFISLAIYNEFLLSLFLNISMLFLQSPANPDLLYIIFFCHVQLTMTLLLCLIFGSKAYIVFRGQGKEGSDEMRQPTSKFISKSRSGQTTKQPSGHNSTGGLHSSTTSTGQDPNLNSRLSEDVQEEFRRVYLQLEELKERNMRLGNRHLVAKIAAMQEAADNILCTSVQINGQHQLSHQGGSGTSPGGKAKSIAVLSDISEEENPSQSQSNDLTLPKSAEATGPESVIDGSNTGGGKVTTTSKNEYRGDNRSVGIRNPKAEEDGQLKKPSGSNSGESKGEKHHDMRDLEKADVTTDKSSRGPVDDAVPLRKLQDTNLDEVEVDEEQGQEHQRRVVAFRENDIKPDCVNDGSDIPTTDAGGHENIPMKNLRKRKHKQQTSKSNSSSEGKSESGLNSSAVGKQGEKSQNHTGSSKIVLDLDDKSRFTEEITV